MPGVEVVLLTLRGGLTRERREDLAGVEVVSLPTFNRRFKVPLPRYRLVRRLVRDAQVVHLMSYWSILSAIVWWTAVRLGRPYVVSPCGTLPIIGRSRFLKRLYQAVVGRQILRRAARVMAITQEESRQLQSIGVDKESIAVLPNGIRPEECRFRADREFRRQFALSDAPFILFLGRLEPIKGPDLLVEAFAELSRERPGLMLVLAGPGGAMRGQLERLARTRGIEDRVRFLGFLDTKRKSWALHAAQLLVIPSRREAMSIVVAEAGATATGVVATDRCGLEQLDEMGAVITVPADAAGLRSGIGAALRDPQAARAMGERLQTFTLDCLTWRAISLRCLELLRSVQAQPRAT